MRYTVWKNIYGISSKHSLENFLKECWHTNHRKYNQQELYNKMDNKNRHEIGRRGTEPNTSVGDAILGFEGCSCCTCCTASLTTHARDDLNACVFQAQALHRGWLNQEILPSWKTRPYGAHSFRQYCRQADNSGTRSFCFPFLAPALCSPFPKKVYSKIVFAPQFIKNYIFKFLKKQKKKLVLWDLFKAV